MNPTSIRIALAAVAAAVGVAAGFGIALWREAQRVDPHTAQAGAAAPAASVPGERRVLYWYDPMVPAQHFAKPGKSPMGMELVPKYADETVEPRP